MECCRLLPLASAYKSGGQEGDGGSACRNGREHQGDGEAVCGAYWVVLFIRHQTKLPTTAPLHTESHAEA